MNSHFGSESRERFLMNSHFGRESRERFLGRLKPGDHIVTVRKQKKYEHHGIFEGNDRIVHFQAPLKSQGKHHSKKGGQGQPKCKNCGYRPSQTGGVVRTCLKCFCRCQTCFAIRYKMHDHQKNGEGMDRSYVEGKAIKGYRCNQIYLELFVDGVLKGHKKIPNGEMLKYEFDDQVELSKFSSSKSAEEVLKVASSCSFRFRKYCFLFNNCEDFAVYCKTGKAVSIQVKNKFGILYKPAKVLYQRLFQRRMNEERRGRDDNYNDILEDLNHLMDLINSRMNKKLSIPKVLDQQRLLQRRITKEERRRWVDYYIDILGSLMDLMKEAQYPIQTW